MGECVASSLAPFPQHDSNRRSKPLCGYQISFRLHNPLDRDALSDKRSGSEERTLSPFPASLVSGEHPYVLNFSSPSNLLVGSVVSEVRAASQGQR